MIKFLGFLLIVYNAGLVLGADREFGHPMFRAFTTQNYGAVGQLSAVAEDAQGLMLFGYLNAILTFDNYRWERISTPETGSVTGLAVDDKGTIWFSSNTEIGYLTGLGNKCHAVKVYSGSLGGNPKIISFDHNLYFSTALGLFIWNHANLSLQRWANDNVSPSSLAVLHGKICIGDRDGNVYELQGNHFIRIAEAHARDAEDVRAIVDCSAGDGLIIRQTGIYKKIGANLVSWQTEIDSLLEGCDIFDARWILGKYLAILVQNRGLFLLDAQGHLVQSFTINSGLADADFQAVGEDRDGGLWVCCETKVYRIQCEAGCTQFDRESGLPGGAINEVVRYKGKIYTGTQRGVYVLASPANPAEAPRFDPFTDQDTQVNGMTITPQAAFAYGSSGTYCLDPDNSSLIRIGPGTSHMSPSETDPTQIFLGTRTGVESIRKSNDKWLSEGTLPAFPYAIVGVDSDEHGNLLVCTENNGFYRVKLAKDAPAAFEGAVVERLPDQENREVPSGNGVSCHWHGLILFPGADRVWQLRSDSNRLEPFELTAKSLRSRRVSSIVSSRLADDYIWVVNRPLDAGPEVGFEVGKLYQNGQYQPLSHAFTYPLGVIYSIWDENIDSEPAAWIAGEYGLTRVTLDRPAFSTRKFDIYPREIVMADGTSFTIREGQRLTFKYDDRDFQIRFGTDHFSVGNELYYSVNLEGPVNHGFARTAAEIWRSGALNEGKYLLRVQAIDSNGVESKEYVLAFTIKPPWYRNVWMVIVYGLATLLGFYLFGRWRIYQMSLRQRELIQLVDLRTQELRRHEVELRNAKDAAETANRAKTAFLANMSHELRTPLNSIVGYAQILLRRRETGHDAGTKLRTILASGEHLLEMINEVLDLSRVESGKVSVEFRSLELPKFIAGIVDEFQLRAAHGQLRFTHEIHGKLPQWIETDPLRLRQVLYNLLGNAVKFTAQGEIVFRVYATSEQLRFEVKDTGKGIPKEDLPLIFSPFYQASNNQLTGQGVGLGLHISKRIVALLGGEISIDSQPGRGSTFSFDIPRRNANPVSLEPGSPQIVGYEGPLRKILVVDDEPLNGAMLTELLAAVGFDTMKAESTDQALSLLKDSFDAVISDIRMPGHDGHTFCRQLRSSDATKNLIIIASSGSVFADDQRLALASGFNDFLPKPVMEEELFEILRRHLQIKWVYAERRSIA